MGTTVDQMLIEMRKAKEVGADVVEIRLGCLRNFNPHQDLEILIKRSPLPTLVTCRWNAQRLSSNLVHVCFTFWVHIIQLVDYGSDGFGNLSEQAHIYTIEAVNLVSWSPFQSVTSHWICWGMAIWPASTYSSTYCYQPLFEHVLVEFLEAHTCFRASNFIKLTSLPCACPAIPLA